MELVCKAFSGDVARMSAYQLSLMSDTAQYGFMNHNMEHETGAAPAPILRLTSGSGDYELLDPSDVAFFQLLSTKPGTVQELGNRAMQAYNVRWRIGMMLRGMPSLRERPRQC
jgi:hypothetical protein